MVQIHAPLPNDYGQLAEKLTGRFCFSGHVSGHVDALDTRHPIDRAVLNAGSLMFQQTIVSSSATEEKWLGL